MKESELKHAVEEYLQYQQNRGNLVYLRLNAGDFIEARGESRRRIKGCPKGTADFLVLQDGMALFLELKSEHGKQSQAQKDFEDMVIGQGHAYSVAKSVEGVMALLGSDV